MDAWLNPTTADYVRASAGGLAFDPAAGLANAVYIRLMTPLGSWWAAPTVGSRLHELRRAKAVANVQLLAQEYARTALQPLLSDGRALSIDVDTELQIGADAGRRLALRVNVVDAAGSSHLFEHHVKVA